MTGCNSKVDEEGADADSRDRVLIGRFRVVRQGRANQGHAREAETQEDCKQYCVRMRSQRQAPT